MNRLINKSKDMVVAQNVLQARHFWQRAIGLMGKRSFDSGTTLWIHSCNSVHTCFMRFPMDAVFVDRKLVVRAIHRDIKPWRVVLPVRKAHSVFEFAAGSNALDQIEVGDQLHVGA